MNGFGGITTTTLFSLPFECLLQYPHTLPTLLIACGALAGWDMREVLCAARRGLHTGAAEPWISC